MKQRLMVFALAGLAGCSGGSRVQTANSPSRIATPNAAQTNPPGDIPDSQAFVRFSLPGKYSVLYPEGWSQSGTSADTIFASSYNGEQLLSQAPADPAFVIHRMFPGVRNIVVHRQTQPNGLVATATFTSKSLPDAITGRSAPLENAAFFFVKGHRETILNLWAPAGSDNVDQWKKISASFRWK